MARIGRPGLHLIDLVDIQVSRILKHSKIGKLDQRVSELETKIVQPSVNMQEAGISASGTTTGFDYSTDPPTPAVFDDIEARLDNFDAFGYTLYARLSALLNDATTIYDSLDTAGSLDVIQYIPDAYITQLPPLPYNPIPDTYCAVYRNGLRLFQGEGYDYTIQNNIIYVEGNTGDRFIVEYHPNTSTS